MRVLIIEDDERVAAALLDAVEDRGYRARHVGTAAGALAAAAGPDRIDVALLDLGLPDRDGMELCRELRAHCPVIVVSARGDVPSRIQGLRAGADDFVVKPFSLGELLARIEAVLRRSREAGVARPVLEVGGVRVDPDARTAAADGRAVTLTPKEFALLLVLAREQGRAVDRQRLVLEVWGSDDAGASRTLDVHVATLRRKLGRRESVETVRGVGYRLVG